MPQQHAPKPARCLRLNKSNGDNVLAVRLGLRFKTISKIGFPFGKGRIRGNRPRISQFLLAFDQSGAAHAHAVHHDSNCELSGSVPTYIFQYFIQRLALQNINSWYLAFYWYYTTIYAKATSGQGQNLQCLT